MTGKSDASGRKSRPDEENCRKKEAGQMRTVGEVSRLAGVSVRTLQYYDNIGLLAPSGYSESGSRLYDDADLAALRQILLFRELQFPLSDIRRIVKSPDFDQDRALEQQIDLLVLKKERLENLIAFARGIKRTGVKQVSFGAFDASRIDEYAKQAKASWGHTPEYREFEVREKTRTPGQTNVLGAGIMRIFAEFGEVRGTDPASDRVQALVRKLQAFISEHFYTCSNEVLSGLGKMYAGGGDFTMNIDLAGGEGTAAFVERAIAVHCS